MNMTPFRYRDIRENGYFRASEIPFNFEYLDYALKGVLLTFNLVSKSAQFWRGLLVNIGLGNRF